MDLPGRFGLVFLGSGGLGVLTDEADVAATFERVYRHLVPGGVFALELQTPPLSGRTLDEAGHWTGEWNATADGALLVTRQIHTYDPETHVRPSVMILERYRDGRLEATEAHEGNMRFWPIATVEALLAEAGFVEVLTTKVFTDDASPGDTTWLAVRARRP